MPIVIGPGPDEFPPGGVAEVGYPLAHYRRQIARETGVFVGSSVRSGTRNYLVDDRYPIKSSLDQGDLYAGKWLLRPRAAVEEDRVRIVAERGYDPQTGTIRPDSAWVNAPVTDEPYEIHGTIEPWEQMNDLVNEGLKRCLVVVDQAVPIPAGSSRVALRPYAPWLQDARWVRQVGWLTGGQMIDTSDPYVNPFRGTVEADGAGYTLRWDGMWLGAGGDLLLKCLKRAYDHCRADDAGVFGEQSGVWAEDNEATVVPEWVAAGALCEFFERYGDVVAGGSRDEVELNQKKAAARFDRMVREYFNLPPYTLLPPVRRGWLVGAY
jgi:hypothetical protein